MCQLPVPRIHEHLQPGQPRPSVQRSVQPPGTGPLALLPRVAGMRVDPMRKASTTAIHGKKRMIPSSMCPARAVRFRRGVNSSINSLLSSVMDIEATSQNSIGARDTHINPPARRLRVKGVTRLVADIVSTSRSTPTAFDENERHRARPMWTENPPRRLAFAIFQVQHFKSRTLTETRASSPSTRSKTLLRARHILSSLRQMASTTAVLRGPPPGPKAVASPVSSARAARLRSWPGRPA